MSTQRHSHSFTRRHFFKKLISVAWWSKLKAILESNSRKDKVEGEEFPVKDCAVKEITDYACPQLHVLNLVLSC